MVVEDACASMDKEHHEAALKIFSDCFGEVAKTAEVIARMARARHDELIRGRRGGGTA